MARLLSATPRYSTLRGRSVVKQSYGDSTTLVPIVPLSGKVRVPGRPGRAVSEPPVRAGLRTGTFSAPPRRHIGDDVEREYASVMADLSLQRSTAASYDADDIYHTSKARDRKLLSNINQAVVNAEPRSLAGRRTTARVNRAPNLSQPRNVYMTSELDYRPQKAPKSKYGMAKKRELDLISRDSEFASMHASVPGAVKRSERKTIRTEDGFSKPSSVNSWKSRVEARMVDADDGIYLPASITKLRDRVRECQDKMDNHRTMLDRYLDNEVRTLATSQPTKNRAKMESQGNVTIIETTEVPVERMREETTVVETQGD